MISDIEDVFTVVEKNIRPYYSSVRPKLSLVGHVSKHRQIVIFSTGSTYLPLRSDLMVIQNWFCPQTVQTVQVFDLMSK